MDGLIHISELSWSHVNHPSEILEIGQTVQVKVLDIDRDRQRISLGLKQTQNDPWQQVLETYHEDDVAGRSRRSSPSAPSSRSCPASRASSTSPSSRASRREPARGRLAGPGGQRQDHRDRRRAPAALALAQARRGSDPACLPPPGTGSAASPAEPEAVADEQVVLEESSTWPFQTPVASWQPIRPRPSKGACRGFGTGGYRRRECR